MNKIQKTDPSQYCSLHLTEVSMVIVNCLSK